MNRRQLLSSLFVLPFLRPRHVSAQVSSFQHGGYGDFGPGFVTMMHGTECVVPMEFWDVLVTSPGARRQPLMIAR